MTMREFSKSLYPSYGHDLLIVVVVMVENIDKCIKNAQMFDFEYFAELQLAGLETDWSAVPQIVMAEVHR